MSNKIERPQLPVPSWCMQRAAKLSQSRRDRGGECPASDQDNNIDTVFKLETAVLYDETSP